MSPIQWKEQSSESTQDTDLSATDPWFGLAMGLIGVIAGYIVASMY